MFFQISDRRIKIHDEKLKNVKIQNIKNLSIDMILDYGIL